MKRWQCSVCKYIHIGDTPPEKCPVCGVSGKKFVLLEDEVDIQGPAKPQASTAAKAQGHSAEKPKIQAKSAPAPKPSPAPVPATLYGKIIGFMLKHHIHPISVHFPNGILPVSVILFFLAWLFDSELMVKTGFINLIFVILALPLVLFSGFMEWTKKYNQALTLIFKIKILAASLTTASCVIVVVWYLIDPLVLSSSLAWMFILVNIVMLTAAGVAGLIGGRLVFKD